MVKLEDVTNTKKGMVIIMNRKFHVTMTEEHYYKYNLFSNLKSPYAKPKMIFSRIVIALCGIFLAALNMKSNKALAVSILVAAAIVELTLVPYMKWAIKLTVKSAKQKNAYTEEAQVELFDDRIRETSADGILEKTYASFDIGCIVKNFGIVLYINPAIAMIIPDSAFKTQEEYNEIVNFIRSKIEKTADFA